MTFLGDTVTMTDDQFCDYVIYQNNALNLSVDDIPTFISKEESPHIKDVMKSALSDFFQKHQTLPRMKCREIAQDIAVVFFDPNARRLPDDVLSDMFKRRADSW